MPQANALPPIQHAHAGTISDEALDHITELAGLAEQGEALTDTDLQLLRLTMRPLFEELRQRRATMDLFHDLSDRENNLLMFPGARDNA